MQIEVLMHLFFYSINIINISYHLQREILDEYKFKRPLIYRFNK